MFKYILFDWDGCLANTLPIWLAGYKEIFKQYKISPSDKEIVDQVFGRWEGPKTFGVNNLEEFTDKLVTEVNKHILCANLHKYVLSTLLSIKKQNKIISIITSSRKSQIQMQLKKHNITNIIDFIISAEDILKHKPDPEGINKILNYFKAPKNQTIIIGDSDKDIIAGKNARITAAVFYPQSNQVYYKKEDLLKLKPDYFFTDFRKLLKIV